MISIKHSDNHLIDLKKDVTLRFVDVIYLYFIRLAS